MPAEPTVKRTIAYFDGQNLVDAAKYAVGYAWPNYHPRLLAEAVCRARGWRLQETRFYTGFPSPNDNPFWNHCWTAKLAQMGREGIGTCSRHLKYRNQTAPLSGGASTTVLVGSEKGSDVRLALDVVAAARDNTCDVVLIFSQHQDLTEVADEARTISVQQNRWIKLACAFPVRPTDSNTRGINNTEWVRVHRATYDACLDTRDYRPKQDTPRRTTSVPIHNFASPAYPGSTRRRRLGCAARGRRGRASQPGRDCDGSDRRRKT